MDFTEDYVSSETAKLLKEKGFRLWCYKCYGTTAYHNGEPISFDEECDLMDAGLGDEIEYVEGGYLYDVGCDNRKEDTKVWAAPTLQRAAKWLRSKYHVNPVPYALSLGWAFDIFDLTNRDITGCRKIFSMDCPSSEQCFESYEEALDAAIKYCLEKLDLIMDDMEQMVVDLINNDYTNITFETRLYDLFGKHEEAIREYIRVGMKFWHYDGNKGCWRKLTVTYVRAGVMFFTFDDEPDKEYAWFMGSINCLCLRAAEIYPYVIAELLSPHYPETANDFPDICKQCKWDDVNGQITVEVIWE